MSTSNEEVLKLKVAAVSERFAQKVAEYENEIADIRVEATLIIQQLREENERLTHKIEEHEANVAVSKQDDESATA